MTDKLRLKSGKRKSTKFALVSQNQSERELDHTSNSSGSFIIGYTLIAVMLFFVGVVCIVLGFISFILNYFDLLYGIITCIGIILMISGAFILIWGEPKGKSLKETSEKTPTQMNKIDFSRWWIIFVLLVIVIGIFTLSIFLSWLFYNHIYFEFVLLMTIWGSLFLSSLSILSYYFQIKGGMVIPFWKKSNK